MHSSKSNRSHNFHNFHKVCGVDFHQNPPASCDVPAFLNVSERVEVKPWCFEEQSNPGKGNGNPTSCTPENVDSSPAQPELALEVSDLMEKSRVNPKDQEIEAALQQAFEKGYQEGHQAAEEAARQKVESSVALHERSAQILDALFRVLSTEARNEIIELAVKMAGKILDREISGDPEWLIQLAETAMKEAEGLGKATVVVHPADYPLVSETLKKLQPGSGKLMIEVLMDEDLEQGGYLIRSRAGEIDGRISQRLENLKKIVCAAIVEAQEVGGA